jgi:hypothetical protein
VIESVPSGTSGPRGLCQYHRDNSHKCAVTTCPKKPRSKGYCGKHAQRFARTGDPLGLQLAPRVERFWSHVSKAGDDGCWLWTGRVESNGYANITSGISPSGGTSRLAHRVAYELLIGPIPDGLHLDHLCRIRHCVNPDHLEPVTIQENVRRGIHGVLRTHCANGHELTGHNLMISADGSRRRCRACHYSYTEKRRAKARLKKNLESPHG